MCISVSNFYMKIINKKHTLLYNLPTIHSMCELTNYNFINIKYYAINYANFSPFHRICSDFNKLFNKNLESIKKAIILQLNSCCILFCKEDVTLLQGALKKLLTSPVIM